jgi:uncharacterized protein
MPKVQVLIKPASGLCNMRCSYCFYADEMKNRKCSSYGIMTVETLEHVIRKVLQFAEKECVIAYQGGEPTLTGLDFYKKAAYFQDIYNVNHVKIVNILQTNGYILDEEWCRFFAEQHFLIGLSIDGIQATHDVYRKDTNGDGTFIRVMHSADLLDQYHVDYNVLTVVNRKTAPRIRQIYGRFAKRGFHYQQYIACLDPIERNQGFHDYSLTSEMYGNFLAELFEMWSQDLSHGQQPYIRQFENYIGILMGEPAESCEQNGVCSCHNVIEADGSVYPCDFYVMDDYLLGNLTRDDYSTINTPKKQMRFIENSRNYAESCKQCKYFNLCRAGCKRYRIPAGQPNEYQNVFCQSYRMLFDSYYDRMCEIARRCMR